MNTNQTATITQKRIADKIVNELEQMILTGEFENNAKLDEIRLAEHFSVSRTPIREALQKLAHSGIVERIPHRGVFVRQPGPTEIFEMFEVMAHLESLCARLAAMRISDDAIVELERVNSECLKAVKSNDPDTYYEKNELFHHIVYRESGNQYLESETRKLHRRLKPFRRMQLQLRGRLGQSMSEHEQIVKFLKAGDGEGAANALRDHVSVQGNKFHHLMSTLTQRQNHSDVQVP